MYKGSRLHLVQLPEALAAPEPEDDALLRVAREARVGDHHVAAQRVAVDEVPGGRGDLPPPSRAFKAFSIRKRWHLWSCLHLAKGLLYRFTHLIYSSINIQ